MSNDPKGSPPVRQTEDGATEVPQEIGATTDSGFPGAPPTILEGEIISPRSNAGRKSLYSPELADEICARIVNGTPLSMICREDGMPSVNTVYDWKQAHPEFGEKFQETRRRQIDMLRDKGEVVCYRLLEATIEPSAAVVALKHIEWNLARLRPDIFGERVGLGIGAPGQQVTLTAQDHEPAAPAKEIEAPTHAFGAEILAYRRHANGSGT